MESYTVRVSKEYLGFCAAHFIVFDNDVCERLHGHNYSIAAELEDDLKPDHLVFDFIELKKILKALGDELDHRMLVPLHSATLSVDAGDESVRIRSASKEWVIPRGDCVLLPIANTTAELLARWFAERLGRELRERLGRPPRRLGVEIYESPGQCARFETRAPD